MKISVRLWQTALFVTVVLVAMLVLSLSLFATLERSVRQATQADLRRDLDEFTYTVRSLVAGPAAGRKQISEHIDRFSTAHGDDVWVFDAKGGLVEARERGLVPRSFVESVRTASLGADQPFTLLQFSDTDVAVGAQTMYDRRGVRVGTVVLADTGADREAILETARSQMVIAFSVALAVSGLLGFVFSEVIRRQIRRLTQAARAIAAGDFTQRLARGRLPDEVAELADSYNMMARRLGEVFSQLQGQEREIAAVVEAMAEGVVAVDERRVVRHANPSAAQVLRVDQSRFVGRPVDEVIRNEALLRPIDEALGGSHVSETATMGVRTLLLHATPVKSPEGSGGAVLLIRDVTEQKRWEEAQQKFIANASHEMRTPIAALKGFLELLEGGAKEKAPVRDEFLKTMQAEVDRLQRLVVDLFTLAQLDSGRVRLDMSEVPLEELVGDVVAVIGPLADEAKVRLETDLSKGAPRVLCDRDRTVQVLLGFLDNSLKYCSPGDTVTVYAHVDGSMVRVGVKDTGPGIPAEALDKVFVRFYRVADDSDSTWKGAGLGLAIAKEIVEAQGSSIAVRSDEGEGADFSFTLRPAA